MKSKQQNKAKENLNLDKVLGNAGDGKNMNKIRRPRRTIRRRRNKEEPCIDSILLEKILKESGLPKAYSFEIPKTVQRIKSVNASHIALQMPEGLLMYSTVLVDALKRLIPTLQEISILGDVTYGACCVDDLGAKALGAQLLVHYGHSCLVPIQHTVIPCLYVFVEIAVDVRHMVECLDATLSKKDTHIYLLGTVQFRHGLIEAKKMLEDKKYTLSIPQAKPLSPGEVLGCTSPKLRDHHDSSHSVVCFIADGRFHLESTLISNPHVTVFYRYDPYSKTLTEEAYDHEKMKEIRSNAIISAKSAKTFGIILGTLGRQGNPGIIQTIQTLLRKHKKQFFLMLLSEITPAKLNLFNNNIDAWVQVACPRLSVDWGHNLALKPVLNPYELHVLFEETKWREAYPMDYYSNDGGPWDNYHESTRDRKL